MNENEQINISKEFNETKYSLELKNITSVNCKIGVEKKIKKEPSKDKNIFKVVKNNRIDNKPKVFEVELNDFFDVKKKNITVKSYFKLENDNLLKFYGADIFREIKKQEKIQISFNLLKRHNVSSEIRTKMVDWIMEVYSVFNYSSITYFTTVHILDTYIAKTTKTLNDSDIHLTGMVCMLIGTKQEESGPLKLEFLFDKVGHKTFSKDQIVQKEREILLEIGVDSILNSSPLECISSFFYDFLQNNKDFVNKYNFETFIAHLEQNSIYYSQILLHFEKFNSYPSCLKGLGCMLVAFDQMRAEYKTIREEEIYYMKEWIRYIVNENKYDYDYSNIYKEICNSVQIYNNLDYIGFNITSHFKKVIDRMREIEHNSDCRFCK